MAIHFYSADAPIPLRERRKLKAFIKDLILQEGFAPGQVSYIFCSDAFLIDINQQFLQHNTYTDIITFPFSGPGEPIEAEIYISVERVEDNACHFNTSEQQELHRVVFHGALHLCGYKDKTVVQRQLMRKMEDKYLAGYYQDDTVSRGTSPRH